MKWKQSFHFMRESCSRFHDETMIHVSDRSVVRFDPIRSWSTNGAAIGRYSRIMAEAERLRQGMLADVGRGDLLKTIIDRVEFW